MKQYDNTVKKGSTSVSGSTAGILAELVNVNKGTAAYYFHRPGGIIALEIANKNILSGEFEVDESYFGHRKGKLWFSWKSFCVRYPENVAV